MSKKRIPWWQPYVGDKEIRLVTKVLKSNYLNEGDSTAEFENKVAKLLGCKYAVAVTSGTAAIFLSLKGLGVGPGDEVLVPDMTFIATANAVDLCGAKPILVDIDPKTLTIDIEAMSRAITPKTRAIVPVHVTGRAADMEEILRIARKHKLFVVEDAAEAFMSKHKGKYLGTHGNAGCFSLSPFKIITTGQGGIIVTNDEKLFKRLRALKDQGRLVRGTGGDDLHNEIGYNFKFSNVHAAIGLGQLDRLKLRMDNIRRTYRLYKENLKPGTITLFKFDIANGELPLWVDGRTDKRDELDEYLRQRGIECRRFWRPLHTQIPYKSADDKFPNSTRLSRESVWLPSSFTMTDKDILMISKHINTFYGK